MKLYFRIFLNVFFFLSFKGGTEEVSQLVEFIHKELSSDPILCTPVNEVLGGRQRCADYRGLHSQPLSQPL